MTELSWQKSTFSSGDGNTNRLELARGPEGRGVWLRESAEPGVVLRGSARRVGALVRWVRERGV